MGMTKKCPGCKIEKPLSDYSADKRQKTGLSCRCRECVRQYNLRTAKYREEYRRQYRADINNRATLLVAGAKRRAAKKGLPFNLSVSDIALRLSNGVCEATKIPFDFTEHGRVKWCWQSPSLDQIDPGKGYLHENVQVVIRGYNVMKNNWGHDPIIMVAEALKNNTRAT